MLRKSVSNVCRIGGHRRQHLHGNSKISPTINNFALSRKPPSSVSGNVLPLSSSSSISNPEYFLPTRPTAFTNSPITNINDTTPRSCLPSIPTPQKIDALMNHLVFKQPRRHFRIVPSTSYGKYDAFVPYYYDTNRYGMSYRYMSTHSIRYHCRARCTLSRGGANTMEANRTTPSIINRITICQYTNNFKDGGTGGAGNSRRAFPNRVKGFILSSEFMGAFGIGVVFATIIAFPTILK